MIRRINRKIGKRGVYAPAWMNSVAIVLAVIIIFFVFAWLLFAGRSNDIKDIQAKGNELRNQAVLNSLLRTPIRTSIPEVIKKGFGKEITYAELIRIYAVEKNEGMKKEYKQLLEAKSKQVLDEVYGKNTLTSDAWYIDTDIGLNIGDKMGKGVMTVIPGFDDKVIRVWLMTE